MEQQIRFSGLPWFPQPDNKVSITIGGAGGIGSWTSFFLTRIGYDIHLYDFDNVEEHNLGGQLFGFTSIGQSKVSAINQIISQFSVQDKLNTYNSAITEDFISSTPYNISAFDNMRARKMLFEAAIRQALTISQEQREHIETNGIIDTSEISISEFPLFIDGRLEAEQLQIYCVDLNSQESIEKYRETLFEDNLVEDAPCSFKQTSHNACLIASLITGLFTNHITNVKEGEKIRPVPFKTEMYVPFMHFQTEE